VSEPLDFYGCSRARLEAWCEEKGLPPYRARQLFRNVYQRGITDLEAMTDLPKVLRADLARLLDFEAAVEVDRLESAEDGALKFLWRLRDGKEIESVLMQADYGETVCFSTQVGCAFRCSFCITARMGRIRQLTASEIVAHVMGTVRHRREPLGRLNLVAMGMGEPMDNLDALLEAVAILQDDLGRNVSGKRITVSTVGVVPGIERLTAEKPTLRLALSLNATTNEIRQQLMPVTRKYPIETVLPALEAHARASRNRVTLEYVLIRGLNDSPADAERLGRIAERFPSKVNVIPFNPSDLFPYERPTPEEVDAFARRLWRYRTTVTVRYSKGLDIRAACGQLGYRQVRGGRYILPPQGSATGLDQDAG
jgi:23S rRNA (adenine2503-C2)-methyltransferase